jgi:hypothetical protein
MQQLLAALKSWVELLLPYMFPKFHNRIVWVIVFVGLSILVSPFWEPILRASLNRYFDVVIDPPVPPIFGFGLIVVALLYHYFAIRLETSARGAEQNKLSADRKGKIGHDLELANRFRELLPDRRKDNLVNRLLNEHACFNDEVNRLDDAHDFLVSAETYFLFEDVRESAQNMAREIRSLNHFIAFKFFIFPEDQRGERRQFAMQPNWNIDRGGSGDIEEMRKYEILEKELVEKVNLFSNTYDGLIRIFHERLTA